MPFSLSQFATVIEIHFFEDGIDLQHKDSIMNKAAQGDRRLAVAQRNPPTSSPPKMMFRFN